MFLIEFSLRGNRLFRTVSWVRPYTPLDAPTAAQIVRVRARVGIQDPTQRLPLGVPSER